MKTGKVVAVRDGSYGLFDNSRVIEGLTPASGLKVPVNAMHAGLLSSILPCV